MNERRFIYCCGCGDDVHAKLLSGVDVYPHRKDLAALPFWGCDECGNFVGCHHKTKNPTNPLGVIPTPELKKARSHIHRILDPIWKTKRMSRGGVYNEIATRKGDKDYHTAEIRSIEEAREVYRIVQIIRTELGMAA